jgi:hypothetical protein
MSASAVPLMWEKSFDLTKCGERGGEGEKERRFILHLLSISNCFLMKDPTTFSLSCKYWPEHIRKSLFCYFWIFHINFFFCLYFCIFLYIILYLWNYIYSIYFNFDGSSLFLFILSFVRFCSPIEIFIAPPNWQGSKWSGLWHVSNRQCIFLWDWCWVLSDQQSKQQLKGEGDKKTFFVNIYHRFIGKW